MSSSKNILRNSPPLGNFLERLKTSHQVQDELPANQYAKSQIERRYKEAHEQGTSLGFEEGFKQGQEQGYQTGLTSGRDEAQQAFDAEHQTQIDAFTQELERLRAQAEEAYSVWFIEAEQRLSVLAIEIAKRALGQELTLDPEIVVEIARQALTETTEGSEFQIRVNLIDAPLLDSRKQQLTESISHARSIEVISDPSVKAGCIVESGASTIDARLESYLARLADSIRGEAA